MRGRAIESLATLSSHVGDAASVSVLAVGVPRAGAGFGLNAVSTVTIRFSVVVFAQVLVSAGGTILAHTSSRGAVSLVTV